MCKMEAGSNGIAGDCVSVYMLVRHGLGEKLNPHNREAKKNKERSKMEARANGIARKPNLKSSRRRPHLQCTSRSRRPPRMSGKPFCF